MCRKAHRTTILGAVSAQGIREGLGTREGGGVRAVAPSLPPDQQGQSPGKGLAVPCHAVLRCSRRWGVGGGGRSHMGHAWHAWGGEVGLDRVVRNLSFLFFLVSLLFLDCPGKKEKEKNMGGKQKRNILSPSLEWCSSWGKVFGKYGGWSFDLASIKSLGGDEIGLFKVFCRCWYGLWCHHMMVCSGVMAWAPSWPELFWPAGTLSCSAQKRTLPLG